MLPPLQTTTASKHAKDYI